MPNINQISTSLQQSKQVNLQIRVLPKSSFNKIMEIAPDRSEHSFQMKIKLTAPALENKANEALIKFLSKELNLPPYHFKIISGIKSRNKRLAINIP